MLFIAIAVNFNITVLAQKVSDYEHPDKDECRTYIV